MGQVQESIIHCKYAVGELGQCAREAREASSIDAV